MHMPPSSSLHRIARSRLLRATALLAWLLMAIAMPAAAAGVPFEQGAPGMASMTMVHAMHAGASTAHGHHADHCCGDTLHPSCYCAALCAAALLPVVPALHGPVRLASLHSPMRGRDAPTPAPIPPLRPPAA
jgi:hypothetical protein